MGANASEVANVSKQILGQHGSDKQYHEEKTQKGTDFGKNLEETIEEFASTAEAEQYTIASDDLCSFEEMDELLHDFIAVTIGLPDRDVHQIDTWR